jgi:hypothetical protein
MKTMHRTIELMTAVSALTLAVACKTMRSDDSSLQSGGVATGELRGFANLGQQIQERLFDATDADTQRLEIEHTAGPGIAEVRFLLGAFSGAGERRQYANGQPNPLNVLLWHQILAQLADKLAAKCDDDLDADRRVSFKLAKLERRFMLQGDETSSDSTSAVSTVSDAPTDSTDTGTAVLEEEEVVVVVEEELPIDPTGSAPTISTSPFDDIRPRLHPTFARQLAALCKAAATAQAPEAAVLDGTWRRVMTEAAALDKEAWKQYVGTTFTGEGSVKEKVADALLGLLLDPEFLLEK